MHQGFSALFLINVQRGEGEDIIFNVILNAYYQ